MHAVEDAEAHDPGFSNFWGHPRPLWMLLGVTVGLNFAFYGFRAYLAPYIEHFFAAMGPAAAQKQADLVSSGFLALMYATPIIGGYVADKVLGETRALLMALWLGVLALALMALPTLIGFEIGMALFALSAGLGIPLTVLVGRTYKTGDSRREGGYTLFYLAINLGAFITPYVCADWVGKSYGYRWGFIAAAAGMLVKVNHVYIPGVNDHETLELAVKVRELGASVMNIMPVIPVGMFRGVARPADATMEMVRNQAELILSQARHCKQCRADAAGLVGQDIDLLALEGRAS